MGRSAVAVRPIGPADTAAVSDFLHEHLNQRVPAAGWSPLLDPPWAEAGPNRGYLMATGDRIVGVYVAVYSLRPRPDGPVTVCNLAAFCVLDDYRAQGLRLLQKLLSQKGLEFTDLSPSGNVVALNERLGFQHLETATRLVPNYPALPGRSRISAAAADLEHRLSGRDAEVYRDHRLAPAVRHLLVERDDRYGYLIFRRDRRKGFRLFATPLFAGGDRAVLADSWPAIGSNLLLRHGLPFTLAERRVLGFVPPGGMDLAEPRPRMVRSQRLAAEDVDYLYSELTLVEW